MKWLLLLFVIKAIAAASENTALTESNSSSIAASVKPAPTPVVLWHGMGDTCCFFFSIGRFKTFLESEIPGIYVLSLRIGNSTVQDYENGYFMNPNKQVSYVCQKLAADKNLANGFNAIGFSQGSQFMRALVQRCANKLPPIKSLVSLGGQHQGVYGIPNCGMLANKTCDYIRKLLNYAAYVSWVQDSLVQAGYWHDPLDEKKYKERSIFLADINNERVVNKKYVKNLKSVDKFIMVKYENDSIVVPRETEWFGYYKPGQSEQLQTLRESDLYIQDRIGLKAMDKAGKLVFLSTPGDHLQMSYEWFKEKIIQPYLLN